GILAAAGLMALREGPARLPEDHRRARELAGTLLEAGHQVDLDTVQTNMVYATIPDAQAQVERWAARGLKANALDTDRVRFVLHYQIGDDLLERAKEIIAGG
ncbi:MAG: threonine aldolase family protein, partial [Deinococcus sp.]